MLEAFCIGNSHSGLVDLYFLRNYIRRQNATALANRKKKDNQHCITQEQGCDLMEKQKAIYTEMLQQQKNNFKAGLKTMMDSTNFRMYAILKELQKLKVRLKYTQKEVDDLKEKVKT